MGQESPLLVSPFCCTGTAIFFFFQYTAILFRPTLPSISFYELTTATQFSKHTELFHYYTISLLYYMWLFFYRNNTLICWLESLPERCGGDSSILVQFSSAGCLRHESAVIILLICWLEPMPERSGGDGSILV